MTIKSVTGTSQRATVQLAVRRLRDACMQLTDDLSDGFPREDCDRIVRSLIGEGTARDIEKTVASLLGPVHQLHAERMAASLFPDGPGGSANIFHRILVPAVGLFERVRSKDQGPFSLLDFRSGCAIEPDDIKAIRRLPHLTNSSRRAWAEQIAGMSLSGKYWATTTDFEPGGWLYLELKERALGKGMWAQRKRFARYQIEGAKGTPRPITPEEFIGMSLNRRFEVIDTKARGRPEPLSNHQAERVAAKARKISDASPTPAALRAALVEQVSNRLRSTKTTT